MGTVILTTPPKAEHTSTLRFSSSTQHKHVPVSPKDMHTAALFTTARTWKGPGTGPWVNALWLIHVTEGSRAVKWMITSYTPHGWISGTVYAVTSTNPVLQHLWQVGGPWGCSCFASSSSEWFCNFVKNHPTVHLWRVCPFLYLYISTKN